MRRLALLAGVSLSALVVTSTLARADGYQTRYVGPPPFSWTGLYLGAHLGGALDTSNISDPFVDPVFGSSRIFGDDVRSAGPFAGIQIGFNHQTGGIVLGLEADLSIASLKGTNTCFEPGTFFFGATCEEHTKGFGTLAGRLGVLTGPSGRTLLFAKAGLAGEEKDFRMAVNNYNATNPPIAGPPNATSGSSFTQFGYVVGAGVEHALTGNWSAKLEYDFLGFGSHSVTTPQSGFFPISTDGRTVGVSQDVHSLRLGLNYRLGASQDPWSDRGSTKDGPMRAVPGLEVEFGGRYVHGSGRFQKDLLANPQQNAPANVSRLTWDGLRTNGGEAFGRVDTQQNLMVKGFIGLGSGSGHINDEDWAVGGLPAAAFYSNTLSDADNKIRYGTIDLGYDWMRGRGYKVAAFVGYNVYSNDMKAFGCTQIAVTPPVPGCGVGLPPGTFILGENDTWKAARVGINGEFNLAPGVRLTGDAAYLPYVKFDGVDNHPLRPGISPEDGHGLGVQLETALAFDLSKDFSLGVGARYWAMRTTEGETNFFSSGNFIPQRFYAEQATFFLQGSYKFGGTCCAAPLK
jgi:opacity protein-like surface antigen